MTRRWLFLGFVLLLVASLAMAGCSKKKTDSTTTSPTATRAAAATTAPCGSATQAPSGGGGGDAVSLENCTQYASFAAAAASAFTSSTSGTLKLDKNALNNVVKTSPGEIRGDMQVIVDALVTYFEALDKIGVNLSDPASFARLDETKLRQIEAATAKLDDEKVQKASDKVDAFFTSKCR